MQDAESNWQFDVHAFAEAAPGKTLRLLTWHYFKQCGLIDAHHLDAEKLFEWLSRIEAGYSAANPYHNRQGVQSEVPSSKLHVPVTAVILVEHWHSCIAVRAAVLPFLMS